MQTNMEYRVARDYLLELVEPIHQMETVPLVEAAGRVLAKDVFAIADVPPFDRSPFDGYAFRAEDTMKACKDHPVTLRILEEIPAGSMWSQLVQPGTATKILTGAPVPPGADAIVKYEDTVFTKETVSIFRSFTKDENVVPQGEDVRAGMQLAKAGIVIDSALLGTLACTARCETIGL